MLNENNTKRYIRYTSLGPVFAECFNKSIRNFLIKVVFERGHANWTDVSPTITKQYNIGIHSSKKLTPIQCCLEKNEAYVHKNLLDKPQKVKPKFQVDDFFRVANLKKTFSKSDTTNWSYKLYRITEIINDTRLTDHIDYLPDRCNEALLKKTELTMKKNNSVMKKLNLN